MPEHETLIGWVDSLTHAITDLELDGLLAAAAPGCWQAAGVCLRSTQPAEQALGYRLVLTALLTTPDAPRLLIERLVGALAGRL